MILGLRNGLSVSWQYQYRNSLDPSQLEVVLWNGHPPFPGTMSIEDPKKLQTTHFTFDLLPSEQVCWVAAGSDKRTYTTADLASYLLKYYMDEADGK